MIITVIIPGLADPSNAYHQQQLAVLTSLAEVKSIILITDLPAADQLITQLFTTCFDLLASSNASASGEQLGKSVELHMVSVLSMVVDESQNLPSEAIDVIVAQFLRTDPRILKSTSGKGKKTAPNAGDQGQSTLEMKDLPPSYNMAKTICNACQDKMARHIGQYFNDVVVDASAASKASSKKMPSRRFSGELPDEEMELDGAPTEDDLKELRKVHQLIRELWRACPAVLQNVIPQLEAELNAENVHLRLLATETLGDIASGIGSAGLPPHAVLDPAKYPPANLTDTSDETLSESILTKPSSPQPFSQAHPAAYQSFLSRCHDKSPVIRAAWSSEIGRILLTSAGGVGLNQQEEEGLVNGLSRALGDVDEKVRIAAIKAVGSFGLRDVVYKLSSSGGLEKPASMLSVFAERLRDRKPHVRKEATTILARLWGSGSGVILAGNEQVQNALGPAPSKILETFYTKEQDMQVLMDHVLFEELIPLRYPPIKAKSSKLANGTSDKSKDVQAQKNAQPDHVDPDKLRVERILTLVKGLDERAKKVFFAILSRQLKLAQVMRVYLQRCEDYNGGVVEGNEQDVKLHLGKLVGFFAENLPESSRVREHLWKFAKMHDRRSYHLIRCCMAPENDYRTVFNGFKEFQKRLPELPQCPHDLPATMTTLLYRVGAFILNKSHVLAIMEFSRSDEKSLAGTAHELLREISTQTPEILKAHVNEICVRLQEEAPDPKKNAELVPLDNLKACAAFALKFPDEIPQDRAFSQAMKQYALHSRPAEAAKYAVTILMTGSDRKEMLANDLLQKCIKDFRYGADGFLSRLATLSQLMLLAPEQATEEFDAISDIAIEQILLQVRDSASSAEEYEWSDLTDAEIEAKFWSLKILVNRIRSHSHPDTLTDIASPVYRLLFKLITHSGEIATQKNTPPAHKSRLRLLASRLCLKLCIKRPTDALLGPDFFNSLALVAQDPLHQVRAKFMQRLKKYLGQSRLPQRFFTIPFLLAFEPSQKLKSDTMNWIRSQNNRLVVARSQQSSPKAPPVMESVFARLISLLAHHPDYGDNAEYLVEFARYIVFYLQTVANEENLSLIYQIAQRVKQCHDAISNSNSFDQNLYHLSDLAQLGIRKFEEAHSWSVQTLPGKVQLPRSLYTEVREHAKAQEIAEHNYLPEEVEDGVEALVRQSLRAARHLASSSSKKRRSDVDHALTDRASKKPKSLAIRKSSTKESSLAADLLGKKSKSKPSSGKTSKRSAKFADYHPEDKGSASAERRRSGRVSSATKGRYAERDDAEDDEEMGEGVAEWRYEDEEGDETKEAAATGGEDDNGEEEEEEANDDSHENDGMAREEEVVEEEEAPVPSSSPPARSSARSSPRGKRGAAVSAGMGTGTGTKRTAPAKEKTKAEEKDKDTVTTGRTRATRAKGR